MNQIVMKTRWFLCWLVAVAICVTHCTSVTGETMAHVVNGARLQVRHPLAPPRTTSKRVTVAFSDAASAPHVASPPVKRVAPRPPRQIVSIGYDDFDPIIAAPAETLPSPPNYKAPAAAGKTQGFVPNTVVEVAPPTKISPPIEMTQDLDTQAHPESIARPTEETEQPSDDAQSQYTDSPCRGCSSVPGCSGGVDCASGCSGCSFDMASTTSGRDQSIRFYGGADWMYVTPRFSHALAFSRFTTDAATGLVTHDDVYSDFERSTNVRAHLGLQSRTCGNDVRFTYWQFDSTARTTGFVPDELTVLATSNLIAATPNEVLLTDSSICGNVFDLAFGRSVAAGGCDGCPPWNLRWSAGVRVADWEFDSVSEALVAGTERTHWSFRGAGPQIGFEGRRFFNTLANWSLYGTLHTAILLGEVEFDQNTAQSVHTSDLTRAVPVSELEFGARWMLTGNAAINLGWSQQMWWDLVEEPSDGSFSSLGSGNLSWDGLILRFELSL